MSLPNRKNQISFLRVRPRENPAAAQNSDNAADTFKQLNNVLLQFDRRTTAVSGAVRTLSGSVSVLSQSFSELTGSYAALSQSVVPVLRVPILSGSLIGPAELTGGTTTNVAHGLARTPIGYFIADEVSGSIVFRTGWNSTNITLSSSLNTAVKLWIF